jgi:hypothetical protein
LRGGRPRGARLFFPLRTRSRLTGRRRKSLFRRDRRQPPDLAGPGPPWPRNRWERPKSSAFGSLTSAGRRSLADSPASSPGHADSSPRRRSSPRISASPRTSALKLGHPTRFESPSLSVCRLFERGPGGTLFKSLTSKSLGGFQMAGRKPDLAPVSQNCVNPPKSD